MTKKARAKDRRLRNTHGITLAEYNAQWKKQKKRCQICKKRKGKKGQLLIMHVDHCHKMARLKVISFKKDGFWRARVVEFPKIRKKHKVRKKAIKAAKLALRRESVRGLICWPCNAGLQKWRDNWANMMRAAMYLKAHQIKYRRVYAYQ